MDLLQDTRTPPQDMAAEEAVLGALLIRERTWDDVSDILEPADFYRPIHETIYATIGHMIAAGKPVDPVTVANQLREDGARVDPTYLYTLSANVPVAANADYYAGIVAECSARRHVIAAGTRVTQLGYSTLPVDQMREDARAAVDDAALGKATTAARTLADMLDEVIEVAEKGRAGMLPTGWPDVDRVIGGLAPGRLVTFGARPGVGKSVLGLNLALHIAERHQHAALVCSMEMPALEVMQRMLANYAHVNLSDLAAGRTGEADWARIATKRDALAALPVTIDDAPTQTVAHIRSRARDVQRKRPDLAVIVVDYLQLVRPDDRKAGRVEQLSQVSMGLKLLARETGACVVALAQLNRGGVRDGGPVLEDIRESGSIENDSDQVILGHVPNDEIPEIEWLIRKNRHGPLGRASLALWGHYARLTSTTRGTE